MDAYGDRPHRSNSSNNSSSSSNNNTTSELFICFTSRLSSSSMKLSSKSILSPGRHRDSSQISLSNSLSRRLRSNGSMKGGQASPMFPTNGKKRGCAFENPEPSSPKVTCIGQVRVKTKKQGKKLRTRSKRRGEISFRRVDQNSNTFEGSTNHHDLINNQFLNQQQQQEQEGLSHRNQRWVHLPVTICEALRAFGAEFNCFLPCRSSCMASEKEKEEKTAAAGSNNNGGSSCGAIFARWLVAVQEGEGKGKEIELVVGEEEEERDERSYRRHVFEDIEIKDEKFEGGNAGLQEEEASVSICIPPKNALLLMRCRSDPVKMAALANKFWESPAPHDEEDEEEDNEDLGAEEDKFINIENKSGVEASQEEEEIKVEQEIMIEQEQDLIVSAKLVYCETNEEHYQIIQETEESLDLLEAGEDGQEIEGTDDNIDGVLQEVYLEKQEEEESETHEVMNLQPAASTQETVSLCSDGSSSHDQEIVDPEALMNDENDYEVVQENEEDNQEDRVFQADQEQVVQELSGDIEENSVSVRLEHETLQVAAIQDSQEQEPESLSVAELQVVQESKEENETEQAEEDGQTGEKSKEGNNSQPLLPDCLLLMMCEPKLSMEVSKETWVCSTDFIRWLPEHSRPVNKTDAVACSSHPRSSCSYPAKPPSRGAGTESMSRMIEQKLAGAKAYEPFVLKRCKSEPMRSASKLAAEACFWKNRKLEPHRPAATLGVGAAGVGF
ncbi:CHLOROPLAST PROTEIN HCF243-RELATED [Salix viminalis]|uniref:CHLOROPLAST PROTEIN HCF243-RELATED n=1 Tax=Salix viminalis TaxID=40686 RepID=A0A9Q0U724_SALVM|nr:CHLOROPLAST PROTEIN HCF243-RELATED [Salix viminalis]